MEILSTPYPIPEAFQRVPRIVVAPYGPMISNQSAAEVFGVAAATLRKWRQNDGFPDYAYKQGNITYYKISDLVAPYYKRFPGTLPDPVFDEEIEALLNSEPYSQKPRQSREAEEAEAAADYPEAVNPRENAVASRGEDVTAILAAAEARMLGRINDTVKEAVAESVSALVEPVPESPPVIEALSAELAAQRNQIDELRAEVQAMNIANERLTEALEQERRWRDKSVMERVMKK